MLCKLFSDLHVIFLLLNKQFVCIKTNNCFFSYGLHELKVLKIGSCFPFLAECKNGNHRRCPILVSNTTCKSSSSIVYIILVTDLFMLLYRTRKVQLCCNGQLNS